MKEQPSNEKKEPLSNKMFFLKNGIMTGAFLGATFLGVMPALLLHQAFKKTELISAFSLDLLSVLACVLAVIPGAIIGSVCAGGLFRLMLGSDCFWGALPSRFVNGFIGRIIRKLFKD